MDGTWHLSSISAMPGNPYTFLITLTLDGQPPKTATLGAQDLLNFGMFRAAVLAQAGVYFVDSGSDWAEKMRSYLPTAHD